MASRQAFDVLPVWAVYLVLVLGGLLAVELGYRLGCSRRRRAPNEPSQPVATMVGATLALLAFLLVFLIGMTHDRFENRRRLVLAEATAIETTYLRAGYLAEPDRTDVRRLLRDYVDVHLEAAHNARRLDATLSRSQAIHTQLWDRAEALARAQGASVMAALFVDAVNTVIAVHTERTIAVETRVPISIWLALWFMATLSLLLVGFHNGLLASRSVVAVVALVLVFAAVVILMVDLDRPQDGLLQVSQQALIDVQQRISAPDR